MQLAVVGAYAHLHAHSRYRECNDLTTCAVAHRNLVLAYRMSRYYVREIGGMS
jgi:hypothetical protein